MKKYALNPLRQTAAVIGIVAVCVAVLSGSAVARSASASRIVFAANQLPRWYGEIYRITQRGQRLDLSHSPAPDIAPAVSPDGRWVAFLSGRGGEWAFYVVGTDGHGLHRISAPLFPLVPNAEPEPEIVWAPNSRSLAAEVSGPTTALYVGARNGSLRLLARDITGWSAVPSFAWSPDGQLLAYSTNLGSVEVLNAARKKVWSAAGGISGSAWSADDLLAVSANTYTVSIYNRTGHRIASFAGASPAWSPGGTLLASASTYALQFRREGRGKPIWHWPARNASPQWISSTKLRLFGQIGWIGLDVAHRRAWRLTALARNYNSAVSPSGQVLAEQAQGARGSNGSALVLSTPGSTATTLATGPWCPEEGDFTGLAFISHGLGLIYETNCGAPSADIYSINPNGSGLHQLTRTSTDEMEPSLSPDGQSVAYVQQLVAGKCDGCAQTLWRVPVGGGTPQQLTSHSDQDAAPFDENPTWSPDGSEIAFQSSGVSAPIRLLTIPATGGSTHDLKAKGAALPVWGPKLIAFADWSVPKLTIKTLDPATGAVRVVATGGRTDAEALAWSASGRLAYLYNDAHGRALVAIVGSKAKPLDLSAHLPAHARVAGLAWSPDGTRFAFAATDANGNGEIYTIATDGGDLRQLTKNIGALYSVGYESTISWH